MITKNTAREPALNRDRIVPRSEPAGRTKYSDDSQTDRDRGACKRRRNGPPWRFTSHRLDGERDEEDSHTQGNESSRW